MGCILYHLDPNVQKQIYLNPLHSKIIKKKYSLVFNKVSLNIYILNIVVNIIFWLILLTTLQVNLISQSLLVNFFFLLHLLAFFILFTLIFNYLDLFLLIALPLLLSSLTRHDRKMVLLFSRILSCVYIYIPNIKTIAYIR